MMFRRSPLAALAALAATAAVAVTATSASAAPTQRAVPARQLVSPIPFSPPPGLCSLLVFQVRGAEAIGNPLLVNLIGRTLQQIGCGGAAI
jgi:hypothetical protein